jgi:hypothetical protein
MPYTAALKKIRMLDAGLLAALQEIASRAGIVTVVLQWIGDGLRHDCVGREVHYRVHPALAQQACDQFTIAHVADHQLAVDDR